MALARAEADGRLRELAGQAGDRVEAQKDREGTLLAAQAIAGDYARQLAALSELQAAHRRRARARPRRAAAAAARPRFGRARRGRRGRLGRVRRRDRLPAGLTRRLPVVFLARALPTVEIIEAILLLKGGRLFVCLLQGRLTR